jgi:S-adenosylmethionine decarboxylase
MAHRRLKWTPRRWLNYFAVRREPKACLGYHWLFDAWGIAWERLTDARIAHALRDVPAQLGLTVVSEPRVASREPEFVAGIVLLAQSHLSLHAFPDRGVLHADLFCCRAFDTAKARAILVELFSVPRFREALRERGPA